MSGAINFLVTKADSANINSAVKRALSLAAKHKIKVDAMTMHMDLTACHANGCRLDLPKLLKADDASFGHDVFGIRRHIDRKTGRLTSSFVPRCAARQGGEYDESPLGIEPDESLRIGDTVIEERPDGVRFRRKKSSAIV